MKILIVTNMYPSADAPYNGIFVAQQVQSLQALGLDVDVFHIPGWRSKISYFSRIPALTRALRENRYDLIHSHHTYCMFPIRLAMLAAAKRLPLVFTFHEGESHVPYELKPEGLSPLKRLVYAKWPKRWALNQADVVLPVAAGITEKLGYRGPTQIIPPGVDLVLFKPLNRVDCRDKLTLPQEKRIIFFPPSPQKHYEKGFGILEEALNRLGRDDIHLITGGNILHTEMPCYLCAADLIVHPSRFEASPMVIKETLACNVPLISSDSGDAKMIIGNTRGCTICQLEPEDLAAKIATGLEFTGPTSGRERIIELGLSLSQIAEKISRVYHTLLAESRSGGPER